LRGETAQFAIRKRDGQVFVLRPEKQGTSPLDVPGLRMKIGRDELVEIIRSSRRPVENA